MDQTTKTVSVYEGLEHARMCFEAVGDVGRALGILAAAEENYLAGARENAAINARIQAYAAMHGLKSYPVAGDNHFSRAIEAFRATMRPRHDAA